MPDTLNDELIRAAFEAQSSFTAEDLRIFFAEHGEPHLNTNTLISRIYLLKKRGVIASCGRGSYTIGARPALQQFLLDEDEPFINIIADKLPHIRFAVWEYSAAAKLANVQIAQNFLFAEADKEACESVFGLIRQSRRDVFLDPDELVLARYASMYERPVIIKPLISEAPLELMKGRTLPSLEKLCVDPLSEPRYFPELKGQAYRTMVKSFFAENVINRNTLRRYAARRGMLPRLEEILHSLNLSLRVPGEA
ncbi:MAG: hypothetical protein JJU35_11765 [Balneolales bacterium]|nr:hypothetical protein [Balneolales bacterium]